MFWKKKKYQHNAKPLGITLNVDINLVSLSNLSRSRQLPPLEAMSSAWQKENCITASLGISVLNIINDNILIVLGADGNIYQNIDFYIPLPSSLGRNFGNEIKVCTENSHMVFTYENIVIMSVPIENIGNMLAGTPLAQFDDSHSALAGIEENVVVKDYSGEGEYSVPMTTKVAENWFKYANAVIKVESQTIYPDGKFPLQLQIKQNS